MKIIDLFSPRGRLLPMQRYLDFLSRSRRNGRESILFCEHPPAITAGIQSRAENLLLSETRLRELGISYQRVQRGGQHTAHEPGQLVCYVHLKLQERERKLGHLFALLLDISKRAIREIWALSVSNQDDAPGLYTASGKKLLSIGLDYRQGLSGFGIALNLSNNLATFQYIHPCGQEGLRLTTLRQETGAYANEEEKTHQFKQALISGIQDWLRPD